MIGWNFPSNGGGQICGVADSGIQTFTGKEILSLAREVCQNSLDAAVDENSAVTVEFYLHKIFANDIPARADFQKILSKCCVYWRGNEKAISFLDAAITSLSLPKNFVLRISDFNTTGLAKPFDARAHDGWNTLTKIDGGATKGGDAAGSFGIGKNAPFTNSFWRMVFYRTLNLKGERAAQGMARLMSFDLDAQNISAGVGYFGETNGNLPVATLPQLEKIFRRTSTGTDIFIYGFNGGDDWQTEIVRELLKNFLVAIHRDKLRLKVQSRAVTKDTLQEILLGDAEKLFDAANYHKILTGDADIKTFEKNFHGMGTLKLRVLHNPKVKLNRKVLIVRKSGMKIFEQKNISGSISFTGILTLEGDALNAFFREMETPAHDKWEPTRHEKRALAKNYLTELKRWVKEQIQSLGKENSSDEVNVEGLSRMLDFDDGAVGGDLKEVETLDTPAPPENFPQEILPTVDESKDSFTLNDTRRTAGDVTDENSDSPAIRTLNGTRTRSQRDKHTGKVNPDGKDTILTDAAQKIPCEKIRVIKIGANTYRLILKVKASISDGRIEIFAVGEDGSREKLPVAHAFAANLIDGVRAVDADIAFANLRPLSEAKINFELQDDKNYTLEVAVHENQR